VAVDQKNPRNQFAAALLMSGSSFHGTSSEKLARVGLSLSVLGGVFAVNRVL